MGEDAHNQSPVDAAESRSESPSDPRESVTHDRQSHIINREAEERARRSDADTDPVMPSDDATAKTRI
jgi:hypothetical protein